jgi:hypothetical protein
MLQDMDKLAQEHVPFIYKCVFTHYALLEPRSAIDTSSFVDRAASPRPLSLIQTTVRFSRSTLYRSLPRPLADAIFALYLLGKDNIYISVRQPLSNTALFPLSRRMLISALLHHPI